MSLKTRNLLQRINSFLQQLDWTVDGSLKKPALSGTLLGIFCLCRLVSGSDLCCSSSFCCCMVISFYFILKTVAASLSFWSLFFFFWGL